MDKKSLYGYSTNSPYRGNPFLDIHTQEGLIDMSNTDIPLYAQDETGYSKILQPHSGMHKFRGNTVREIPLKKGGPSPEKAHEMLRDGTANGKKLTKKQKRYFGWIYGKSKKQDGGVLGKAYDFLFDEDEDETSTQTEAPVSAPSVDTEQQMADLVRQQRKMTLQQNMELAMQNANFDLDERPRYRGTAGQPLAKGLQQDVVSATDELLSQFPGLRVTSTIRSWGDKDAHPLGRAVDIAGGADDVFKKAFEYYKNTIVPKYKFNPALDPNHGTGRHIHVGYY